MKRNYWPKCEYCKQYHRENSYCVYKIVPVGIRFCDNDFRNTIRAWLTMYRNSMCQHYNWSKDQIVLLYNETIASVYCIVQGGDNVLKEKQSYEKYLQISVENVFLGDEVLKQSEDIGNNGDFHFYIDRESILTA